MPVSEDGHVAMVIRAGLPEHPDGPDGERALASEERVIAVDDARGVDLAADQGLGGVALAADVVAVLAEQDVEPAYVAVHPVPCQPIERDQRGLRRVPRAHC